MIKDLYIPLFKSARNLRNQLKAESACKAMGEAGFSMRPDGICWFNDEVSQVATGLKFVNGFQIISAHMGAEANTSAILAKRLYFENGKDAPAKTAEWKLAKTIKLPKRLPCELQGRRIERFHANVVERTKLLSREPIKLASVKRELSRGGDWRIGSQVIGLNERLSSHLVRNRLGISQGKATIGICAATPTADDALTARLNMFSHRIESLKLNKYVRLEAVPIDDAADWCQPGKVLLILVPGHKGDPLPNDVGKLMRALDQRLSSYRLASLDNSSERDQWAILPQLHILLTMCGIRTFELEISKLPSLCTPIFVGLDLGHPKRTRRSIVVPTIVDSCGHLVAYKRFTQPRDETVRSQTLQAVLQWIAETLAKLDLSEHPLVIFRDGRLFENEPVTKYQKVLGDNIVFLEVMKNGVPHVFDSVVHKFPGLSCKFENCNYRVVQSTRYVTNGGIPRAVKVNTVHNGIKISDALIDEWLVQLCYAPTLGLNPTNLPAPVYWANGVAAISEHNHQFSGLNHACHT